MCPSLIIITMLNFSAHVLRKARHAKIYTKQVWGVLIQPILCTFMFFSARNKIQLGFVIGAKTKLPKHLNENELFLQVKSNPQFIMAHSRNISLEVIFRRKTNSHHVSPFSPLTECCTASHQLRVGECQNLCRVFFQQSIHVGKIQSPLQKAFFMSDRLLFL